MKISQMLAGAAVLALTAGAAIANDTTAERAAGGLVFKQTADIDMVSEDLFVSVDRVRVAYVFRNRRDRDVTVTVAFPMPDRNLAEEEYSNAAYPHDFATRVGGRAVTTQIERKAMLGEVDHSATLAAMGVSLVEVGDQRIGDALDRLPAAQQARLVELGLARVEEWDQGQGMERHLVPLWTLKETYYWEQTFPAGRDLAVTHEYVPGAGGSVGSGIVMPEFRNSAEGRQLIADYCMDSAFLAGADRLARQAGEYPVVPERTVSYILTTGANWASPIGSFRLVVDKGDAANIVSFCGEGVRRISPTQFEVRHTNWRPTRDLRVLILQPPPRPVG